MQTPVPLTRDLVLLGGGHTHALILRRWGMRPLPGVRVTVINPAPSAPYTGMLPGHVAGHYPRAALDIDVVRLARFAGARMVPGIGVAIDRVAKTVSVQDYSSGTARAPVPYDILSIDIGVGWANPGIAGFDDHAVPVKPMGPFARAWAAYVDAVAAGAKPPSVAVIGAGVAGVEIALAMAHRLRALGQRPTLTICEGGRALARTAPAARRRLLARVEEAGITLIEGAAVQSVVEAGVTLETGQTVPAAFVAAAAGAQPQAWLADTGLPLTDGFVTVGADLRSPADPSIFAAGDCAHFAHAPRPKAGVYAVRAAPVLFQNLRAALSGGARRRFTPQRDFLKLVSLGDQRALAERGGMVIEGDWVWRWKDRIDRAFMRKLSDLAPMAPKPPAGPVAEGVRRAMAGPMPCAGCGAKIGAPALIRGLEKIPAVPRTDVIVAPGDDAAILTAGNAQVAISTDHLRAFTLDPWLLAEVAAHHALNDILAMGATPQAALTSLVLPHMTEAMQRTTLAEISEAAGRVFAAAGAAIVGGHTTLGAEMTLGFTVTGLLDQPPVLLSGARPGDALILTKPLGSGTVLAGEMALKAPGEVVLATYAAMRMPQGPAARILGRAHAMTDVTGFGLLGHLRAMLRASTTGAEIVADAVPLLAGALDLARAGVRSTLYPANVAGAGEVLDQGEPSAERAARTALFYDPQTAGGLLAAVPQAQGQALLDALVAAGYPAAVIGKITPEVGALILV